MPPRQPSGMHPLLSFALIFFGILLLGLLFVSCLSLGELPLDGNVAVIEVSGEIVSDDAGGLFGGGASASELVGLIGEADENPAIKAIILRINSPGGTPVASEEIAHAVRNASKPTVALIRDQGTSGAYWVASAADGIVASPISIVGSIGVLGSSLEFSGFMEEHGIGYERLIAGKYKDAGIPFRNLTIEERALLQERLELIHRYFIQSVAQNRGLSYAETEALATGIFYTGEQGLSLRLVDRLGGEDEAIAMAQELAGLDDASLVEYSRPEGFFESLYGASSGFGFAIGQGFGQRLLSEQFKVRT